MKFCTTTLGCKVNQVETESIESILVSMGHKLAKLGEGCNVCIINTCAVTSESARKSRQAIRRIKKAEPDALIAVCGCLSQLESDAVKKLGADIVGGSRDRREFALRIEQTISGLVAQTDHCTPHSSGHDPHNFTANDRYDHLENLPLKSTSGRTRAFLKVQDGCDNFCAYCIIPLARGGVRSLPLDHAISQAESLQSQGFKEIVITGIEISSYGKDLEADLSVIDVIYAISKAAPHTRIRLGSLDPGVFDERFCNALAQIENLCNHFHLSLQSGCDDTLLRMGRKYTTSSVAHCIAHLRKLFPDCGITADLIVGFPGETDAEFEHTLHFIASVGFSAMHVFPFSPRPNTRAYDMPDQILPSVRRDRARQAIALAEKNALAFKRSQIGQVIDVLFERKKDGYWVGNSANYLEVAVQGDGAKNSIRPVRVTDVVDGMVLGEIVKLVF
ncbi:MAG: tRNA (N(6)-L-threonylcarbamoyladenosine(37)-C(2))-methylthiotransferase MtaB [Oscillospiraceae bacterium]|nr:tRNA (N(6)-L-threonylcarbamoyladenosine(37)-C(2))-methylthiotransferase MtaB [Oscillospiraceae bacterium]